MSEPRILTYPEAIREALFQAMEADPSVFVLGQGVDDPWAMFGTTSGLSGRFGPDRVFDTPLSEAALAGVATGAAICGQKPVYMHNRPDFLLLAMDQIANHAAKWSSMYGGRAGKVPLVIWACTGRGWGAAAQHSQALHGLFLHVPGLKVVLPSDPCDAKGLLLSALADPGPVMVFEHRDNFRLTGPVPEEPYFTPIGRGIIRRAGGDVTIAAVSAAVGLALLAAETLKENGIEAEVIDLRSAKPLDAVLVAESVRRTGRLVVCDTGCPVGGLAAELVASVSEAAFGFLETRPLRLGPPDLSVPASPALEAAYFPSEDDVVRVVMGIFA